METITLRAHFDGEKILLDENYELEPNTKLLITVVNSDSLDEEREDWYRLSASNLAHAYSGDEPEYTNDMIKEWNPDYDGR